jgi:hypothetical protein
VCLLAKTVISQANQELCIISGHLTESLRARSGAKRAKRRQELINTRS